MHSSFRSLVSAACLGMSLPLASFAASTPAQILNQAILHPDTIVSPTQSESTFAIDGKVNVGKEFTNFSLKIAASTYTTPTSSKTTLPDQEGRLQIQYKINNSTPAAGSGAWLDAAMSELLLKIDQPLIIQWKIVNGMVYARVERVPLVWYNYLKSNGMNTDRIIGQWVDLQKVAKDENLLSAATLIPQRRLLTQQPQTAKELETMLSKLKLFSYVQVVGRSKNQTGEQMVRLRAQVNPNLLETVRVQAIKQLRTELKTASSGSKSYIQAQIKSTNKDFTKLRTLFQGMKVVAYVNMNQQRLERIEFGGTYADKYCYAYNYAAKTGLPTTCKAYTTVATKYHGGNSSMLKPWRAIEAPANAISMDTYGQMISEEFAKTQPAPTPVDPAVYNQAMLPSNTVTLHSSDAGMTY